MKGKIESDTSVQVEEVLPSRICSELHDLAEKHDVELDKAQYEIISSHVEDVVHSAQLSTPMPSKLYPLLSVLRSFNHLLVHLSVVYMSNPLGPIIDFTNHFYGAVAYLLIYLTLFAFQALLVVANLLGVHKATKWVSKRYAGGYGMTSWANIKMYENKTNVINASRAVLSSELEHHDLSKPEPQYIELDFSMEVAKSILLMSSIIYERDQIAVREAFDHGRDMLQSKIRGEHHSGSQLDFEQCSLGNYQKTVHQVAKDLWKSEKKIHSAAKEWDLKFISIADFQKAEGPFVGAFYDLNATPCPFMVVVFKGTSPEAISEWIVDATLNLECSSDKLGAGFAHQGFYTSLFPCASSKKQPSPYLRIIKAIHRVAQEWRSSEAGKDKPNVRMNLFVGGHSLGAGIASLFYARLLESPDDLGPDITLRDAYCFGTPRACDSLLASRVEYNLSKTHNLRKTMWRIANRAASGRFGDIVTHVPPGMADGRETRSSFRVASFLSYSAIGVPVDLFPNIKEPLCKFPSIPCGYELKPIHILGKNRPSKLDLDHRMDFINPTIGPVNDPIRVFNSVLKTLIPVLHDHFPGSYYESLEKIVPFKDEDWEATLKKKKLIKHHHHHHPHHH